MTRVVLEGRKDNCCPQRFAYIEVRVGMVDTSGFGIGILKSNQVGRIALSTAVEECQKQQQQQKILAHNSSSSSFSETSSKSRNSYKRAPPTAATDSQQHLQQQS